MPPERTLLAMMPGAGIAAPDFESQGLFPAARLLAPGLALAAIDPGMDAYLDGSVERRLLARIEEARRETGATRVWLAGISLGCQGILRCIRLCPDLAAGAILLTPYLASTGVIAEVTGAGGLRGWTARSRDPERDLLGWLATATLPPILLGRALADRFAATAALVAGRLAPSQVLTVSGGHDWTSWRALWSLVLDRRPFA